MKVWRSAHLFEGDRNTTGHCMGLAIAAVFYESALCPFPESRIL